MLSIRACLILFFLSLFIDVSAQEEREVDYYPYAPTTDDYTPLIIADSSIFYRAIHYADDVFGNITEYNLGFVASKRRGQSYEKGQVSLNGLTLSQNYTSVLRALSITERRVSGANVGLNEVGGAGGIRTFDFVDDVPLPRHAISISGTDRNYRLGAKFHIAEVMRRGWSLCGAVDMRTGRDVRVAGVFTSSAAVSVRASKLYDNGGAFVVMLSVSPSMRGLRSSSSAEAFELTDDKLYNPSWGYFNGKVRNAHVRRDFVPIAVASYKSNISTSTRLLLSIGAEYGTQRYSSLGWYDAATPMPDNYRYLPSYFTDERVAEEVADAWRTKDTRYTQIAWDELYERNRRSGEAHYALEDWVERPLKLQSSIRLTTDIGERLTLHYGVTAKYNNTRYYKQMRDLIGGNHITDIDQYLVGDDAYGNMLQNNLRDPNRRIVEGDRFGYDYAIRSSQIGLMCIVDYHANRLKMSVAADVSDACISRQGYYEKELFSGSGSFGRSRKMTFTPYTLKATIGYAFSPRHSISVTAMTSRQMPDASDLYLEPRYNNRTIDNAKLYDTNAADVAYNYNGRIFNIRVSAYAISTANEVDVRRYFDDIAGAYCDMVASHIGTLCYGAEATVNARISYNWSANLAIAAGRYAYSDNPLITLYADADNTVVASDIQSYMGDCRVGNAPQLSGVADINYYGGRGWGIRIAANYAGHRYVEPALMRRTKRVAQQTSDSQEAFVTMMHQEQLNDEVTLDISLSKTFFIKQSRISATIMIKNILNNSDMVYAGYESLRIQRIRYGDDYSYQPFATRYSYAYPRSIYAVVSYKF